MQLQFYLGLLGLLPLCTATPSESRVEEVLRRYQGTNNIAARKDSNSSSNATSPNFVYQTAFDGVTWDVRNWLLSSTELDQGHYQSRGSVANGYIGINVASTGPFFELDVPVNGDVISGWPLFSRRQTFTGLAGFWAQQPQTNSSNFPWLSQYGGESPIAGIPHWGGLVLDLGDGQYLDAKVKSDTISNYTTTYDFKAGILSWQYTWKPKKGGPSFNIAYKLFSHKLYVNQAVVQLTVEPSANGRASVVNILEGYSAVRTDFVESGSDGDAIYSAVKPVGVNATAYVYAVLDGDEHLDLSSAKLVHDEPYLYRNASTVAQSVPVKFTKGKAVTITKFVGIASTDAFSDPKKVAKQAAFVGKRKGYESGVRSHVSEWAQVMPEESVDDFTYDNGTLPTDAFIVESSIMAVVNPYYLLQNTVGENAVQKTANAPVNDYSISVGGLYSDSYAGLVFWDADVWMQPGLVAAFPLSAKRITNYRVATYEQAKKNIESAYTSSQNKTHFSEGAALYPWTSGRTGNCTAVGPCFDYEYHLNGDIGIALVNQWVTTGDNKTFQDSYFPVYNSVATAFADLLVKNGSHWTLTNMTDPDEYANHVDAGGFTMPLIAETLQNANSFRKQFGLEQNDTWNDMAENILIIRENDVTLEYTTMNNSVAVKQADVVLNTYPLDYNNQHFGQSAALSDLDYYALKQSPDGPGMTYAIFSIVANKVSPSGCSSYTYAQYSYSPYVRAPFFQFSEQLLDDFTANGGTHPAYPFLTGHGGANQVVLFGYLGFRLLPDTKIHLDPSLPPQIPQITYRTFYWHGWPITAKSNYTHTTVARQVTTAPLVTADKAYANSTIVIEVGSGDDVKTYNLPASGATVTIPNRKIGTVNTVEGNVVQCQPAQSWDSFLPGQFPISVVDGAASTKWEPEFAANVSAVTVTIPESKTGKLSGFYFDWAQSPPTNATVIFHNNSIESASAHSELFSAKSGSGSFRIQLRVNISDPWTAQTNSDSDIRLQGGNTTNYTLSASVPASKYATLFIQGNQALEEREIKYKNGTGATVAEWAILES